MATFHRRAEWERYTTQNVTGPAQDKTPVVYLTIHYNGTTEDLDGPNNVLEDEDYARFLARTNNAYWSSRGFALGYNWGLAPDGDLWDIRGTDIRCAANGCQAVNVPAVEPTGHEGT